MKKRIPNRRRKLAIIDRFIDAIENRRSFLLTGHHNPDEDCVASMVAYGLLLAKFYKPSVIVLSKENWERFPYLMSICKYNSIRVVGEPEGIGDGFDTVGVLDTPKPSMIQFERHIRPLMDDPGTVVMEVDHHLEADGEYIGDEEYRLVDYASSTCELIGSLAMVVSKRRKLIKRHGLGEVFTRNLVLAIVTGIVADSRMGQFIKSRREKRHYSYFSRLFNRMLMEKTDKYSGNLSSIQNILDELEKLSIEEGDCCRSFSVYKQARPWISWIALDQEATRPLLDTYDLEVMVTVSRYFADVLAEESRGVSLVAYYEDPNHSDFIQIRMRRSQNYKKFDLRKVIEHFGIEDGGGHEGAVGFRVPRDRVTDFPAFIEMIVSGTLEIMGEG